MLGLLDPAAVVRHRWAETVEGLKVAIVNEHGECVKILKEHGAK